MAERNPITPRSSAYSAYVPEADPAWVRGQALIGKEKRAQDIYDYVLAKTGSQEQASRFTDQAMRTMDRQEITGAVTGAAPFLARGAEGTVNLASRVLGRAPVFTRPLEGQVLSPLLGGGRNARTPDEMLELAAPPTRPAIGYQPRDTVGTPSRTRDMTSEGGVDPESILQARRIRESEAATNRALESTRFEGEGGSTADVIQAAKDVHNRRIAAEQARRDMELARFEDEGGGMANTRVPPSFSREFTMGETVPSTQGIPKGRPYFDYPPLALNPTGRSVVGEGLSASNELPLFAQGERSLDLRGASSGPKDWTYKTYVHPSDLPPHPETDFSTWSFGRPESGPRAPIGSPGAPAAVETLPAVVEGGASQGASKSTGSNFPLSRNEVLSSVGTGLAGGAGLVYFEPQIRSFIRSALTETPNSTSQPSRDQENKSAEAPAFSQVGGNYNDSFNAPYSAPSAATVPSQRAASAPARPAPAPATDRVAQVQEAAANPANMSLRKLWEAATASGEARDFFRADQAMQSAIKKGEDVGFYGQPEGKKAGGSVNGKDAAVHKALEIIQHMITRR